MVQGGKGIHPTIEIIREYSVPSRYVTTMVHVHGLQMNRLDQSAAEMHRRSEKGELDLMTFLQTAAESFPDGSEDLKKTVRGERIAQNVRKECGIDWADTDDAGYQRLKEVSFAVGLDEQYSSSDFVSDGEESSDGVEFEEHVDRELRE
jgi:hypothetical protein